MKPSMQPIIIKKKKGHGHGHHGGAWKVAYADFVTAMMAFFLLLWLLGNTTEEEQRAISGYFQDPGGGLIGAGGANQGVIQFPHPLSQPNPNELPPPPQVRPNAPTGGDNLLHEAPASAITPVELSEQQLREQLEKIEAEQLEQLKAKIEQELQNADSTLQELRDQILLDYTEMGLRIQIIDKERRPMFDLGSPSLKPYTAEVLMAMAPLINGVENRISITGHTDSLSFGAGSLYTNWELSTDRANTARRALLDGGYPEKKILTVQGMGDGAPFNADDPNDPANRRIAIIVLKKSIEEALLGHKGTTSRKVIKSEGKILEPVKGAR
jgi:chemotaxis protein MotB